MAVPRATVSPLEFGEIGRVSLGWNSFLRCLHTAVGKSGDPVETQGIIIHTPTILLAGIIVYSLPIMV